MDWTCCWQDLIKWGQVWKEDWCTWCCWRFRRSTAITSTDGVALLGRPSLSTPSPFAPPLWLAGPLLVTSVPDSCIMTYKPEKRTEKQKTGTAVKTRSHEVTFQWTKLQTSVVSFPHDSTSGFPCWFVLLCVSFLLACNMCSEVKLSQTASVLHWTLLDFVVSVANPAQMISTYFLIGRREWGSSFVCVLQYRLCVGVWWRAWGPAHIGEEPNLSRVGAKEPKKTLDLQNKTLSMEMDIFTCMAPRRTAAVAGSTGFLMGNRATVWGLPKDLLEKHPIWSRAKKDKSWRSAQLTPKCKSEYK